MNKNKHDSGGESAHENENSRLGSLADRSAGQGAKQVTTSATARNANNMPDSPDVARSIGGWMIIILWIMALAGATFLAQGWLTQRTEARNGLWIGAEGESPALLVESNRYGQYQVKGSANNTDVMFLLDTGASGISIPSVIAEKLQLKRGRPFEVMTANGITTVYATTLDTLRIGPHMRENVEAHINPSMSGDMALLGMSFLRHYELLQRAGQLTISKPQGLRQN